jgi:hypothetical protein
MVNTHGASFKEGAPFLCFYPMDLTKWHSLAYNNQYDSLTKEPVLVDWLTVLFLCRESLGRRLANAMKLRETPKGVPIKPK